MITLAENGKVYSCGRNTDGQLGIGDNETLDYAALPMFVTEIDDEIIQLTAGSHHSLLLTGKVNIHLYLIVKLKFKLKRFHEFSKELGSKFYYKRLCVLWGVRG